MLDDDSRLVYIEELSSVSLVEDLYKVEVLVPVGKFNWVEEKYA
jgi:hypothetical protein